MSEMEDGFKIVRGLVDWLETRAEHEPDLVRGTLVDVVARIRSHGRPKRRGNKHRGVGFTFDEAQIMASLDEYDGSIERAARAYWDGLREDQIDANIRTLYRHKKDLEDIGETF